MMSSGCFNFTSAAFIASIFSIIFQDNFKSRQ